MTTDVLYANLKKKYNTLIDKLSSLSDSKSSNICLICKKYNTTSGCTLPKGEKCLLDPDEEKLR